MSEHGHGAHAHQFENITQQREAASFGMWVFLVTEVMFFGGLFFAYGIYRYQYPQVWHDMSHHLDVVLGTINTGVLLLSSLTMALAVHAAHSGHQKNLFRYLVVTILLACCFLVIKYFEYHHKFETGMVPGTLFHFETPHGNKAQLFLSLYFTTTGLHGLHVIIGIVLLGILAVNTKRGCYPAERYQVIEIAGLYWHFVDLVWIYVFPLYYLIGRT